MFTIKAILFPTDYSEGSAHAFSLACDLAVSRGARLVALHVVEPPLYCGEFNAPMPPAHVVRDRVEQWVTQRRGRGALPTLECRVAEGLAWEQIPLVAADCRCDLIVMGSEGKTGLGRAVLGSVAESVARQAPCPVLIDKQPAGTRDGKAGDAGQPLFSTILFPSDMSDRAQHAFEVASTLAGPETWLVVQHVLTTSDHSSPQVESACLERLHKLYPESPDAHVTYRVDIGDPIDEIRWAAENLDHGLIVMSSHGRTGVSRLLLGSVAEPVLRAVKVPVIVVPDAKPGSAPRPGAVAVPTGATPV